VICRWRCVSWGSCVVWGLIHDLTCWSIKRFYCLTCLRSHVIAVIHTRVMNMMMIYGPWAISLLLVLLLLNHDAFRRHVRGWCRRHVLGHLQSLLCLTCTSWRLSSITLVLWNEVLENAYVISTSTRIRRVVCSFGTQNWVHHKVVTM
jgi:hypothetical protein